MWPRPVWFQGALLNDTENMLAHANRLLKQTAFSACREGGTELRHLTWKELHSDVAKWSVLLQVTESQVSCTHITCFTFSS